MSKWRRVTGRIVVVFAPLLCAAYLTLFVYGAVQLRRAQRFVSTLNSVRLGMPFAEKSGASSFTSTECNLDGPCFVGASFTNIPFANKWPELGKDMSKIAFGKRWLVNFSIKLDSSRNVIQKSVLGLDPSFPSWEFTSSGTPYDMLHPKFPAKIARYHEVWKNFSGTHPPQP